MCVKLRICQVILVVIWQIYCLDHVHCNDNTLYLHYYHYSYYRHSRGLLEGGGWGPPGDGMCVLYDDDEKGLLYGFLCV